jgi:PAS domain S-box-containing protein
MNNMQNDSDADATTNGGGGTDEESKDVYEAIFNEMSDAVFLVDVEKTSEDYKFTYQRNNASHQQQTGLSEDELRGRTPHELLGEDQGAVVAGNYRRCVEQGETIEYEEQLELPAGTSHWQTKLTPITETGEVTQIVGVARDITEQKQQEQELQRIHRRFETVMETMSAAVFLKDTDGQYLMMNQASRELFNIENQDIVGLTDEDLLPPDVAKKVKKDDQRAIENEEVVEIEETVPTAAGNTVRLTRKSPVFNDDGDIVALCVVSTDITGQKDREQELQRLKERFELAVEGANLGVWDWDMTTDEVEFNEQWAQMLGYSLAEIEPHLKEWERRVHPDDIDRVNEALEAHIAGETDLYDTEHRMQAADGTWTWIRDVGQIAERGEDGEPVRAVGIHLEIDERKQAEQELKRQNSRLNEFASVVSHDLRNPLNVAQARAAILQQQDDDELEEHLVPLVTSLERMENIIEDTLMLARQGENVGEMSSVSVIELIGNCWRGVETADATLEIDDEFTIRGDRDRLRHVFENLFRNAVEHGGEDVTVRVGRVGETGIYVEDDGPGIPPSDRETVFEPGHTSAAGGTGFGLTIVKRIAEAHGWEVVVTDGRDGGARFEFDTPGLIDE